MARGRIIKSLSGFYDVLSDQGERIQCRGRGNFRNKKITPLVGDYVEFEYRNEKEGYILSIDKRFNELVRPPISNVDQAIIVTSVKEPDLSLKLLDRFLILVEAKSIKPILFFTKMDLLSEEEAEKIVEKLKYYQDIEYEIEFLTASDQTSNQQITKYLGEKVSVIAGQSGVGKTSLLNKVLPELNLETDQISESLGRGKHTTRHVELIAVDNGLVADTPGFSSLDFSEIDLDILPECFPEFAARQHLCKFRGCKHIKEPKCAVKEALAEKRILTERYEHYLQYHEEIRNRKPRY